MVMVLDVKEAETPAGRPVGVPISVAPVVVCVILVIAVFGQTVGAMDATLAVFTFTTTPADVTLHPAKLVAVTVYVPSAALFKVLTIAGVNRCMRLLLTSATYTLPLPSTYTLIGRSN